MAVGRVSDYTRRTLPRRCFNAPVTHAGSLPCAPRPQNADTAAAVSCEPDVHRTAAYAPQRPAGGTMGQRQQTTSIRTVTGRRPGRAGRDAPTHTATTESLHIVLNKFSLHYVIFHSIDLKVMWQHFVLAGSLSLVQTIEIKPYCLMVLRATPLVSERSNATISMHRSIGSSNPFKQAKLSAGHHL